MTLGSDMAVDVAAEGGMLLISQVAPAAGDYTLNGVTQTAASVGQVLQWLATVGGGNLATGNSLTFNSTAVILGNTVSSGPIGFSAIPEPSSLALFGLGLFVLRVFRRKR
jgi:hypothetical protein